MAIPDKDIKMLWGLAAGRCSAPGCQADCVPFLSPDGPTVIGEMAHVIARSPEGPRGVSAGGPDSYENLILLCPTDHTKVDKASTGTYPPDLLRDWKREHEASVRRSLTAVQYSEKSPLFRDIHRLLVENHETWRAYGPDSAAAEKNPLSALAELWALRKLASIVPNNRRIIDLLRVHRGLLTEAEYGLAAEFIEHAEAFEANCYERRDDAPRFPSAFAAMVKADGES